MRGSMKRAAATLLAGVTLLGITAPQAAAQARAGTPLFVPSVAAQALNPNFRITPGTLAVGQTAFNISVLGRALRHVPPYAFGYNPYNPYPQMVGYGPVYPGPAYMMGGIGYGGAMMTAGAGYGGTLMTAGSGGTMSSPYAYSPDYTASLSTPYQAGSSASGNSTKIEGRLVQPSKDSTLVSASRPEHPDTTRDVWIYDSYFSPSTIMVRAGTTVRWINYGYHSHSVAAQDGDWDSGPMRRGAEYSITLSQPGTYRYFCRYHPDQMVAKIIVTK
jgi:plastocyanin